MGIDKNKITLVNNGIEIQPYNQNLQDIIQLSAQEEFLKKRFSRFNRSIQFREKKI